MTSFRVLGPVEAWVDEHWLVLGGRQQVKLLAFLLVNANRALSADAVIDAVWGAEREGAAKRLHMAVSRLRKSLAPMDGPDGSRLRTVSGGYLLSVRSGEVDADVFAERVRDGRRVLEAGDPARASELLAAGLGLWRGPPLAEVAFDDFAQGEIRRLEELRLVALETRIEADLQLGRHAELIAELEGILAEQPTRERIAGQLMTSLYCSGRQTEALEVYQHTRVRLAEQLGLEPGPVLKKLQSKILEQDQSLSERAMPQEDKVFEAVRPGGHPENVALPLPASSFIGRSRELAELTALLRGRRTRILTLTGAGGIGKSRLALRAAEDSASAYQDGVAFAGFDDVSDPGLIVPVICDAVGLDDHPTVAPVLLKRWLKQREFLLVLDNLEQVVGGTAILGELLSSCRGLVLLVTSRTPLHLAGEHQYEVPALTQADAIDLFTRRAKAAAPGVSLDDGIVGKICDRLDALPLPIELAAARARALSPVEILARLDKALPLLTGGPRDAPDRQRTLRATIDWSYRLLNAEQRQLFTRLAVFAGGWTLRAAETVCGAELDVLQALVDQSLVRRNGDRYSMLGTLREYALDELEREGELYEFRRRHHRWIASLLDAEMDVPKYLTDLEPTETPQWLTQSSARSLERENIRAALVWALQDRGWSGWRRA